MKRRILSIALTLCMLLSMVPMSALAAETYDLYINNFRFSPTNLTYTSGGGSATYDPTSKTLTIKDLSLSTGGANTIIQSGISGLTIKIDGTLALNILASKAENGVDYGKNITNYGIAVTADTTICGANNVDKDSIIITSQSTGIDMVEYSDGTTRVGISAMCDANMNGAKLTVKNLTVSMTDKSTGDNAGHASMIRATNTLNISGCKLVADKCQFGIFVDAHVPVTISNTEFSMALNGEVSSGVNLAPNAVNVMENCSGSISAEYPIYTAGPLTISGGNMKLVASSSGILSGQNQEYTPGNLIIDKNAQLEIQSEALGLSAEYGGSITMKSGTVTVTKATYGVQVTEGSSFAMQGGTLSIRGANAKSCLGIKNKGKVTITGGSLKMENVYTAIQNDSGTALSVTGGEHTLTASACGYLGDTSSELKISNTAKVTINAATGIQLPASSNSKLTVSGGELNINATTRGIDLVDSTSAMTLSGGKVNITDKNSTPTIHGMYCKGNTQFTGAEVTFKNCGRGLLVANSSSKMTGGKLHLSGYYFGAQFTFGFEMTGGEIDGSTYAYGIVVSQGNTTLKGGTVNLTASYPFYLTYGGIIDFAGANVTGNASANSGLLVDPDTEGNSYKISGGTVVLTSTQAGANELYTSIPSNYGVWAGADEASAVLVDTPTQPILASNKYVRFAEKKAVTLTLVNVKEGTSASYLPGASFTYTAKDAPSDKHFSHWELTVDGRTTTVGTDTTYSGRMPAGDATLTAVYENCSGGTATCQHLAVCSVCGKEYGILRAHDFTAEVEDPKYVITPATCESGGTYYKSCSVCGASSENWNNATFTVPALDHDWSKWISTGHDTHSRICSRDTNHTETEACSGGTATCQQKAVCDFCHEEYGELGDHSYTATVAESQYLKTAATCTEAAVYYKSCPGCCASSKDTAFEETFSHGEPLKHAWGEWISKGDDTHSRTCSRNANHTETEACSGGTATCQQKAVCAFCHAEYGELAAHSYTAEVAESRYLKSAATSTEAAVYYKSCSVCGASSKGTAFESTFSHGGPLGHVDVRYLYCDENGANWQTGTKLASEYTRVTTSNTSWGTSGKTTWYVVQDTVTIGSRVTVSGDVRLILTDGCTLTVTGGIQVQDNSTESTPNTNALTIYAQSVPVLNADGTVADGNKAGRLTAQIMEETDAAIGGNENGDGGTITINGGIVDAKGEYHGAGIGGGGNSTLLEGGSGGTITINGGFVKATGNSSAAIGGGCYGAGGGTITINGGIVKAESLAGAGIGGGLGCNGGIVTITGGIVTASSDESAGIGAGIDEHGKNQNYSNSSTFQTQEADAATNGNAVIFASSLIGDQSGKYSWHGVIFEGAVGKVYGTSVTPTEDFTIDSNMALLILEGETLTIATDVTAVNNGRVFVDGNLIGTMGGTGEVYYHLTVTGATATPTFNYINKTYGKAGETVTLTGTNIPEGQVLDGWTTSNSAVTVENNAFTMPDKALTVTARIKTIGTVSIDDPSKVYDSQPVSMDGKYTVNGTGTVTVEYKAKDAEDVTYTQIAPTDAGSYTVRISVAASDNYTAAFATQDFTITKAAQTAPDVPTVKSKTYNSVELEQIPDNANGAKAQYSMDGGATWQDSPGFTDLTPSTAYRFVARYRETDNYFASPVSTELSVTTSAAHSSGGSSTPTYAPTVTRPDQGGGSVTVSPKAPKKGDTVTITPKPEDGYTVEQIIVTDKNGDPVTVKDNGDGTYTFQQPSGKVTVTVTFKETARDNRIVLTLGSPAATVFGEQVTNDVAPIARNNRTLLPIRFVAEALGAQVDWNADLQKVTISKADLLIEVYLGQTTAYVGGSPVVLDVAAFAENNRTYLPLRFVAETLGAEVLWDQATQSITIIPA